jgi:glutamyl-tRNA synthetase
MKNCYRGRIAPTPTGYLHLGHARTFWIAMQRARTAGGMLIYRNEDLDPQRCKTSYANSAVEDLHWFGLNWDEGPDLGGPHSPYCQSQRTEYFLNAWAKLKATGHIYPCNRSRRDVNFASSAPHVEDEKTEPIYPIDWRPAAGAWDADLTPGATNWRFKVPANRTIRFHDQRLGECAFECQRDFGDFLVWRRDGVPAYELAVVVDDAAMQISEVVRGEDLLLSTARQLLIYEALGLVAPAFFHTSLLCDAFGQRLAKRTQALSLREMRASGETPERIRQSPEWSA